MSAGPSRRPPGPRGVARGAVGKTSAGAASHHARTRPSRRRTPPRQPASSPERTPGAAPPAARALQTSRSTVTSGELELRFLVGPGQAAAALLAARDHLTHEVHDGARPVAYSRTLYLDTPDRRYLRGGWPGQSPERGPAMPGADPADPAEPAERVRVRVRQYAGASTLDGTPCITSQAFLEIKRSVGTRRVKLRAALPTGEMARLLCGRLGPAVMDRLARVPPLAALALDLGRGALVPHAMTWYRRTSLSDSRVRVTLDEAICYCRPEGLIEPGRPALPGSLLAREGRSVLEIKARGSLPAWLEQALAPLGPAADVSKFRAAMAALDRAQSPAAAIPLPLLGRA